jgi:2-polyprenyl-3-methyl-5-hydroxy-6-metoxy-1,4-benzoquinol methylase
VQRIISILRAILPDGVRRLPPLQRAKNFLNHIFLGHDGVYSDQYYRETVESPAVMSAGMICGSVMETFAPRSMIDVGCGTGALLRAFNENGVKVKGLEYSEAGLAYCRQRGLDVLKFDLERDNLPENARYDVAVSLEVAEHLPERIADKYVGLLARLSNVVVFTAAPPGQGGQDHVNEQPPAYWLAKFAAHNFHLDSELTSSWKNQWRASGAVASWYYDNLLVLAKSN